MRYYELIETPIEQYAALGNWEDNQGSFNSSNPRETSKGIVNNSKAIAKIKDIWKRVPQTFNFYMINVPGSRIEHMIADVKDFKSERLAPYVDQMKLSTEAINVIYTTNFTSPSNYMPMTAWIMAHRLWHIFQFELDEDQPVRHNIDVLLSNAFVDTFNGITGELFSKGRNFFGLSGPLTEIRELLETLIPKIFTMRSARMNKLTNELDIPAELFAQYLITGKVTFASLPKAIELKNKTYEVPTQLNAIWHKLAKQLEQEFEQLLNECVGKVLVL